LQRTDTERGGATPRCHSVRSGHWRVPLPAPCCRRRDQAVEVLRCPAWQALCISLLLNRDGELAGFCRSGQVLPRGAMGARSWGWPGASLGSRQPRAVRWSLQERHAARMALLGGAERRQRGGTRVLSCRQLKTLRPLLLVALHDRRQRQVARRLWRLRQRRRVEVIQFGATRSRVHVPHAPRHARAFLEPDHLPRKPVTLTMT
jgi:hypothetical protein